MISVMVIVIVVVHVHVFAFTTQMVVLVRGALVRVKLTSSDLIRKQPCQFPGIVGF